MESFNDRFSSIFDFLNLTIVTISNNFYNLVILWAISSISSFALDLVFDKDSIIKLYFTTLIFTYVNVITALMVNSDCQDEEFNFADAMKIARKHSIGFFLLDLLVAFIIVFTSFIVAFSIGNTIGWIVLLIAYPIIIVYLLLRYKFCLQLTAFYDVGAFEALSRSYQITRSFVLRLLFVYSFVFVFTLVTSYIFSLFPALINSFLTQFILIFVSIFDAYVVLNILCMKDETDGSYSDVYSDYYSKKDYKTPRPKYDTYETQKPNMLNSMNIADDTTSDNYWDE